MLQRIAVVTAIIVGHDIALIDRRMRSIQSSDVSISRPPTYVAVGLQVVLLFETQPFPVKAPLTKSQIVDGGGEHGPETVGILVELDHSLFKLEFLVPSLVDTEPPRLPPDHDTAVPIAMLAEEAVETHLVSVRAISAVVRSRIVGALGKSSSEGHSEQVEVMDRPTGD
jgi:hypothetical protein